MIFILLKILGRKRLLMDRGPSHPKFNNAKPWMNRYYIFLKKRPRWFPFNIFIHEMLDNDHGNGVHNHPYPYLTIILKGGYWETLENGIFWRKTGYIGIRSANRLHRVDINKNQKPITLFFSGPYGFRINKRSSYGQCLNK